jgi:hypothetical protein
MLTIHNSSPLGACLRFCGDAESDHRKRRANMDAMRCGMGSGFPIFSIRAVLAALQHMK